MSNSNNYRAELDAYLHQIAENLPSYIKKNKDDVSDILLELEQHVLDKADELANGGPIQVQSVRMAIAAMGPAEKVAKAYRRQSTPKIYISAELWPYYIRFLKIFITVMIIANTLGFIIDIIQGQGLQAIYKMISGTITSSALIFTILTLVFFWLSKQGYIPEDFNEKPVKKEKPLVKTGGTRLKMQRWIHGVEKIVETKNERYKSIISAFFQLIFAYFLLTLPFLPSNSVLVNPDFLLSMRILGVLTLISAFLELVKVLIKKNRGDILALLMIINLILTIIAVGVLLDLSRRPAIIPIFVYNNGQFAVLPMPVELLDKIHLALNILIIIIIISMLS
ncbi:MAG: HAAS signaling domain-containing protein, partial [Promethearchaeota archaeon]